MYQMRNYSEINSFACANVLSKWRRWLVYAKIELYIVVHYHLSQMPNVAAKECPIQNYSEIYFSGIVLQYFENEDNDQYV